jgi:hypothetical protein
VVKSGIYFVGQADRGMRIQFLNFATGQVTPVAPVNKLPQTCLSVSPDGRFLLYSLREIAGSDLMLVENFR